MLTSADSPLLAGRRVGYDLVHCAIDDLSRLAYAEIHPDETARTCAGFLHTAAVFFARHGIDRIERVMTDSALAYRRSHAWRQALSNLGAEPRFTRSYRPQTTGKAERFNRTLADEWVTCPRFFGLVCPCPPFHGHDGEATAGWRGWLFS